MIFILSYKTQRNGGDMILEIVYIVQEAIKLWKFIKKIDITLFMLNEVFAFLYFLFQELRKSLFIYEFKY